MARPKKANVTLAYDRRATVLPRGAKVAVSVVDDPYAKGDKITVLASIRDDPLYGMLARRQIDQAQYMAGRKWQEYYENSEIGGIGAIDTTKEPVDGRRFPEMFTERHSRAIQELKSASLALGKEGDALIRDVLGRGMTLAGAAAYRGYLPVPDCQDMRYLGRRFRECIESLAVLWGYAAKENNP
jgi:hypothetical protein